VLHSGFMDLEVEATRGEQGSVIGLRGEIDVYTAPLLRQKIVDVVDEGAVNLVIDMSSVDFLDSTGLGVLVQGLRRVKMRGGSLSLVITQDKIRKIFDITGLNQAFPIFTTQAEALHGSAQTS
jgi:anti-sigma B factor antagonist